MSIEKITPNEIDEFKADQLDEVEFLKAVNYLKRLADGFEDELLSRINSPQKFVKIDEDNIGELNLTAESIETNEKGEQSSSFDEPTQNEKLAIYKSNFELDNTDDEIKNAFEKSENEFDGKAKPKFQLDNSFAGFFDEDDDSSDNKDSSSKTTEKSNESSNDEDDFNELTEDEINGDTSIGTKEQEDTPPKNEDAKNNLVATKKINSPKELEDEFNVYHKSKSLPEKITDIVDDDNFGAESEKVFARLKENRAGVDLDDEIVSHTKTTKTDSTNYANIFANIYDFGGIKSCDRYASAKVTRTVINLKGLGLLELEKWKRLSDISEKTLTEFLELPSFTEFKKVQFAVGENDINKLIYDYQSIITKFISNGNTLLNMTENELQNELNSLQKK